MHILHSSRLTIRHLTQDDAPFILSLLNQPSFLYFIGDKGVRDEVDAIRYLENGPLASYRQHGFGLFWAGLKDTETPIGMCGILKRENLEFPDLGFAYLESFQGKGYGTEAALAVYRYGLEELGLERIVGITAPDNYASQAVLKKCGLQCERELVLEGETRSSLLFS